MRRPLPPQPTPNAAAAAPAAGRSSWMRPIEEEDEPTRAFDRVEDLERVEHLEHLERALLAEDARDAHDAHDAKTRIGSNALASSVLPSVVVEHDERELHTRVAAASYSALSELPRMPSSAPQRAPGWPFEQEDRLTTFHVRAPFDRPSDPRGATGVTGVADSFESASLEDYLVDDVEPSIVVMHPRDDRGSRLAAEQPTFAGGRTPRPSTVPGDVPRAMPERQAAGPRHASEAWPRDRRHAIHPHAAVALPTRPIPPMPIMTAPARDTTRARARAGGGAEVRAAAFGYDPRYDPRAESHPHESSVENPWTFSTGPSSSRANHSRPSLPVATKSSTLHLLAAVALTLFGIVVVLASALVVRSNQLDRANAASQRPVETATESIPRARPRTPERPSPTSATPASSARALAPTSAPHAN